MDDGRTTVATRAERTARTRDALLDAATALFAERGVTAVSLREVAAAAGVSHQGLRRHFGSKDALLGAVVERFALRRMDGLRLEDGTGGADLDVVVEVARRNAAEPGYVALFSGLAGAATRTDHPAHDRLRSWHADHLAGATQALAAAVVSGEVALDLDPAADALRLDAAWDGLQVLALYVPSIDVPELLAYRLATWRGDGAAGSSGPGQDATAGPTAAPAPESADRTAASDPANAPGYAPGRRQRARIVADASDLFARRGYHGTSLRDVAERVGVGKSTLLHHVGSKEGLLAAVLADRDRRTDLGMGAVGTDAAAVLRSLPDAARHEHAERPGLIELYAVLSTEAVAATHPAHPYFAERFGAGLAYFTGVLDDAATRGTLRAGLDPASEAAWLVGLWDGLQLRWLLEPGVVDVAAHLADHVAWLLGGA